MWKALVRRAIPEWMKPRRERGRRSCVAQNFVPCLQVKSQNSSLFSCTNQHSNEGKEERKHTCHDQSNHQYKLSAASFLETCGWVGSFFVLGLHLHEFCWKADRSPKINKDVCGRLCTLLHPLAFNMPSNKHSSHLNVLDTSLAIQEKTVEQAAENTEEEVEGDISKVCEDIVGVTLEYFGHLENVAGVSTKDKQRAFLHFKKAAKFGSLKSHFNLGICYETGHGTKIDLVKAAEHYRVASKAGHSLATFNLGVYYLEGKGGLPLDETKGLELISQAAEQGILQAQTYMGIHYLEQRQWNKAFSLLQEASKQDSEAKYHLATCYENGWGVNRDYTNAIQLYQEAASAGNLDALNTVDLICEKDTIAIEDNKPVHKGIQAYASVPELNKGKEDKPCTPRYEKEISRYLDIFFPNLWKPKVTDWVDDSQNEAQVLNSEFPLKSQLTLSTVDIVGAV